MKSVVFLVSGGGGNLKALYLANKYGMTRKFKFFVVADRDCDALNFASTYGVDNCSIDYSRDKPDILRKTLYAINPDIIVTNWHKIIDAETVSLFSDKLINLHYSLLPAFSGLVGLEPIKKAYSQGCKFIGSTCHLVDEGVDTGKILAQSIFDTNRSYDDSVQLMFRTGVMTLLAGIKLQLNEDETIVREEFLHESIKPDFYLDMRFRDPMFWEKVSKL